MKHDIKIYKIRIFSTIAFYYECYKSGKKKGEGVGWEATLNQGQSLHFLTFVMYGATSERVVRRSCLIGLGVCVWASTEKLEKFCLN